MHVTSTSQLTCLTSFTLRRSELRGQGPDLSRPLPSFLHTSFPSRAVLFYSGASLVFLQLLLFTGCSLPSVVSLFLPVLHRCPSVKLNVMSAATCFYLSQISAFRVCLRLSVARFTFSIPFTTFSLYQLHIHSVLALHRASARKPKKQLTIPRGHSSFGFRYASLAVNVAPPSYGSHRMIVFLPNITFRCQCFSSMSF